MNKIDILKSERVLRNKICRFNRVDRRTVINYEQVKFLSQN
jgi:hypothetical protein